MQIEEARPFIRRMFAAHGRRADDAIVDEYAQVMCDATCEPCAVFTIERVRTEGRLYDTGPRRVPTAPELRHGIAISGASVEHGRHLGSSTAAEQASVLETFWRQRAVRLIAPHVGGDQDLARFIAAQMWWAGVHAGFGDVAGELADEFDAAWAAPARVFLGARGEPTAAIAERAFTRSRRAVIDGEENLAASLVDLKEPA